MLGEPLAVGEAAGALVGVEPVLGVDSLLVGLEVLSVSTAVKLKQHRASILASFTNASTKSYA